MIVTTILNPASIMTITDVATVAKGSKFNPWFVLGCAGIVAWLALISSYAIRYRGYDYPDEAANAFFAATFADSGQFRYATGLTPSQLNVYRPRSVGISGSDYIPGSFTGFITVHGLALRLGTYAPFFITILIFGVALVAWYRLVRRYWEWSWAFLSVIIVMTIPAVAVYQSLPWLHASLFTSFLLLTGLALVRFQEQQTWVRAATVGLAYGAALFIRPVEVIWTGLAVAIAMIVHKKGWLYLLGTAVVAVAIQMPWIIVSRRIFGATLATGYTPQGIALAAETDRAAGGAVSWYRVLIPPGGWSWQFIPATWESLVILFPVLSIMSVVALIIYSRRKFSDPKKILKIGLIFLLGVYYLVYYGSADLTTPNDPVLAGVLSSYVRYWLPLYVAMTAGAIVFLRFITKRRLAAAWPIMILLVGVNVWTTLGHFAGGLNALRQQDLRFQHIVEQIRGLTEPNSLIITGRYDKAIVPYRLASFHQPETPAEWAMLGEIAMKRPVYLIGSIMAGRIATWQALAGENGLAVVDAGSVDEDTLWRVTTITERR